MNRLLFTLLGLFTVFSPVEAGLFENREQRAASLFEKGEYATAADEFEDDYRQGVALYRAGKYQQAAESFEKVERDSVRTEVHT